MTMDYTAWNQPVSIPAAPTDAHPFSELTGGLGFDDVAYITQFAQIGVSLEAHGNALGNLPDSGLSDEQRAAVQDGLQGIRDDLSAIVALTPTARFAGSHEKFVDAQKTCDDAFGEAIRQLDAGADELDPSLEGAFEECDAELSAASDAYSSEVPAPKQ
jgi:hypothetical protein